MKTVLSFWSHLKIQKFFLCLMMLIGFLPHLEGTYITRFTGTLNGGISYTGNTVGLSKAPGQNNQGTADSIGAFTSVNTGLQVGNFPAGTTLSIAENSSAAVLDLPPGSTIIYAELVISGSYGFPSTPFPPPLPPPPNVSVMLTDPSGVTTTLSCDPATMQNAMTPGFPLSGNYVRSVAVTDQVVAGGTGTYIVSQVPGTVVASENSRNAAGWTLAVIYENPNMNTNNINFWVACEQGSLSFTAKEITGFCAPSSGPISARLYVSVTEGDANITGDHMLFGNTPTLAFPGDALFGDNNPANNFFGSQLNTLVTFGTDAHGKFIPIGSGQLDTRGTFGNRNQNPQQAINISGGRQGQDITSIDISNKISHGQTVAYSLGNTVIDDFTLSSLGIQIQIGAPIIVATKLVNEQTSIDATVGETVAFSTSFINQGTLDASDLVFHDVLPTGLTFLAGSVVVNGVPQPLATLDTIPLGALPIGDSVTVDFNATVNSIPLASCFYTNVATVDYDFMACAQTVPTSVTVQTNAVTINLAKIGPWIQTSKNVNLTQSTIGDIATYTISLQNLGDTVADSLIIQDSLPFGLTFIPGSVSINGIPSADNPSSISIAELGVDPTPTLVTFQVRVTAPPTTAHCTYDNLAQISYQYTDCNGMIISPTIMTNSISFPFQLPMAQILAIQTVNPLSVRLNGIVTFSISLTNQSLTPATNLFFQDLLPVGLNFQTNSVRIDGTLTPNNDPNLGFSLNNLAPGATTVIQFQAQAQDFPVEGCSYMNSATVMYTIPCATDPILSVTTNQVLIPLILMGASLTATKTVTPSLVAHHDKVTYTITLTNTGDRPTSSVIFKDVLPDGLSFVPQSFTYNNKTLDISHLHHVPLPNLAVNESAIIEFQATVDHLPKDGCLYDNRASIKYTYAHCDGTFPLQTVQTNIASFNIKGHNPIKATKLVNSHHSIEASLGEIVTFSFDVKHETKAFMESLLFTDILPPSLSFVSGSFILNGIPQPDPNLTNGVNIGPISPGQTIHLEFQAKILAPLPTNPYSNRATVTYQFIDACSGETVTGSTETDPALIFLGIPDPSHFHGKIKKCKYLDKTTYTLVAKWKAPAGNPGVKFYRIYHHGKVVAVIDADHQLIYKKCLGSSKKAKGYKVAAVYKGHIESARIKLRITHD